MIPPKPRPIEVRLLGVGETGEARSYSRDQHLEAVRWRRGCGRRSGVGWRDLLPSVLKCGGPKSLRSNLAHLFKEEVAGQLEEPSRDRCRRCKE